MEETTMQEETQLSPIQVREMEVESYSNNIKNYENILSSINGEWDKDLVHLKDLENHDAARQCEMDRLERLGELQLFRQVTNLLKTEKVERQKALIILNSLKNN